MQNEFEAESVNTYAYTQLTLVNGSSIIRVEFGGQYYGLNI